MTRPARRTATAVREADAASDRLETWLRQQRGPEAAPECFGSPDASFLSAGVTTLSDAATAGGETLDTREMIEPGARERAPPGRLVDDGDHTAAAAAPLRLPHTDWLHHRLVVSGPAAAFADFCAASCGAGTIPWQLDGERLEEDLFYRLVSPPAPQRRRLSLDGARELARQLREAAEARHAAACARVGLSQACPFDLHALLPVPPDILRRGEADPAGLAWLWQHWGTTAALRHVAIEPPPALRTPLPAGTATRRISFWSADWTPWRALAAVRARWPVLHIDVRPTYGLL